MSFLLVDNLATKAKVLAAGSGAASESVGVHGDDGGVRLELLVGVADKLALALAGELECVEAGDDLCCGWSCFPE